MSERNVERAWWGGDPNLYDYDALRPERTLDRNGPVVRKEFVAVNKDEKVTIGHLADMAQSLSKAMRSLAAGETAEIVAEVAKIVAPVATTTRSRSPEAEAKRTGKRFNCLETSCERSHTGNGFRSKGEATNAGLANHLHVAHGYTVAKANAAVA